MNVNSLKVLSIANLFVMIVRVFWIMIDKNYNYNLFDEIILNPVDVISFNTTKFSAYYFFFFPDIDICEKP